MERSALQFEYPEALVATQPAYPPRVLWVENGVPQEMRFDALKKQFKAGDVLVVNTSKVLKRKIILENGFDILFIDSNDQKNWEVLCLATRLNQGHVFELPGGVKATLTQKGHPQKLEADRPLENDYFEQNGVYPIPPYISQARQNRSENFVAKDELWYQTPFAEKNGSIASPTASLHFKPDDINQLKEMGVEVFPVVLHVGLGTFLPIKSQNLDEHKMHAEWVEVPASTMSAIEAAKRENRRVWALGTTVARTLESWSHGLLDQTEEGAKGWTKLFIKPGFEFKTVDRLLTNFHQPESTLLALVAAFSNLETVQQSYKWAVENKYRLFSYGDLSVWVP